MDTKSAIYIPGGEVKVVTLLEKLTPDYWLTENEKHHTLTPPVDSPAPLGIEASLARLTAGIRNEMIGRVRQDILETRTIREDMEARYLSAAERRQAAMFTQVATGWLRGIQRTGLAIGQLTQIWIRTPML